MQSTALPLPRPPSTCNQTNTVVPTPLSTIQHLPTLTSLSSKTNQNPLIQTFVLPNESTKNISCFNCGSNQHTGVECQEASMEDVNRGIYKLDYNSSGVNDTVTKTTSELVDNGSSSSVKTSDTHNVAHMSSSVLNK